MLQSKVNLKTLLASYLQLLLLFNLQQQFAAAYFQGCDYAYNLNLGNSTLESPYYPNRYPSETSCRYKFVAPQDYYIEATCDIDLEQISSGCSSEYFFISRDGDSSLSTSEDFCGQKFVQRKSTFRSIVFAYISTSASSGGRFRCNLNVKPQPCDCGWSVNTKIVNGIEAGVNQYPSMVAIRDKMSWDWQPFCGGTIVSHYYVITAAHCTRYQPDPTRLLVLMGDHDMSNNTETIFAVQHNIQQIIEHPYYNQITNENDIALLRTVRAIDWSRGVGPICLPPATDASKSFVYEPSKVLGWGTKSFGGAPSAKLLSADLSIASNDVCKQRYAGKATVTDTMICTRDIWGHNSDSCQLDSGGPVIITKQARQFLVGIISSGEGCGLGEALGINTRVTSYLSWINYYIGQTCPVAM